MNRSELRALAEAAAEGARGVHARWEYEDAVTDPSTVLALLDRLEEAEARLGMLCEAVGDFHTAITCMDSDLIIPDMLAEMYEERDRARAFLAGEERQ